MHNLQELEKQQVGLRLHSYLVDELDEMTKEFSVNRSDIIVEAIKSYISAQKTLAIYEGFDVASKELHQAIKNNTKLQSLDELINELEQR